MFDKFEHKLVMPLTQFAAQPRNSRSPQVRSKQCAACKAPFVRHVYRRVRGGHVRVVVFDCQCHLINVNGSQKTMTGRNYEERNAFFKTRTWLMNQDRYGTHYTSSPWGHLISNHNLVINGNVIT